MLQNSLQHPGPAPLLARSVSRYVPLLSISRQLSWAGLLNGAILRLSRAWGHLRPSWSVLEASWRPWWSALAVLEVTMKLH